MQVHLDAELLRARLNDFDFAYEGIVVEELRMSIQRKACCIMPYVHPHTRRCCLAHTVLPLLLP